MTEVCIAADAPFRVEPSAVLDAAAKRQPLDVVVIERYAGGVEIASSCSGEETFALIEIALERLEELTYEVSDD
jgi:hypothetical protein